MIIVMKAGASEKEIAHVVEILEKRGLEPRSIVGESRTIIGAVGDESALSEIPFISVPGVEKAMRVMRPYKLASSEVHPNPSVFEINGSKLGGGYFGVMAGPCSVETREQLHENAKSVKASGASYLRGGAFKPRTSPYAFQGMGEEGLKYLREVGDENNMAVVTEVLDTRRVDLVEKYADVFQVGARNMQNFELLKALGEARKPVIIKRGLAAKVEDLLMAAEYVLAGGNEQVILCERGVRTFEDSTRFTLDISAVPVIRASSHLPVIVDPSHAAGRRDIIPALARASVAAGADGLMIETHPTPEFAASDGAQTLTLESFDKLMTDVKKLTELLGIKLS